MLLTKDKNSKRENTKAAGAMLQKKNPDTMYFHMHLICISHVKSCCRFRNQKKIYAVRSIFNLFLPAFCFNHKGLFFSLKQNCVNLAVFGSLA